MNYNNRNYGNRYSQSGNNYGNNYGNRYSQSGNNYRNNYQRQPKKRSGAKFQSMEGAPIINAWRVSRRQMWVLYARPYKNTKTVESKNGKDWVNLFVTITNRDTMQVINTSGMYDINAKRLYIKEHNLIVTNKGRGGYFGKHLSNSYDR